MSCKNVCRLCPRLIISEAVTFADGTLTINIPAGSYNNCEKYCIVVAQSIPTTTTRDAPVVVTIGEGTVEYPLVDCNGAQVSQIAIESRTKYSTRVATTPTGGTFRILGRACCAPINNLTAIDGTAPAAAGGDGA